MLLNHGGSVLEKNKLKSVEANSRSIGSIGFHLRGPKNRPPAIKTLEIEKSLQSASLSTAWASKWLILAIKSDLINCLTSRTQNSSRLRRELFSVLVVFAFINISNQNICFIMRHRFERDKLALFPSYTRFEQRIWKRQTRPLSPSAFVSFTNLANFYEKNLQH